MKTKARQAFLLAVLLVVSCMLPACGATATDTQSQTSTAGSGLQISAANKLSSYEYSQTDLDASWDEATATKINLTGDGASVKGAGAASDGGSVTITAPGTYVVSGQLTGGQLVVDAGKNDLVRIVLAGVDITSDTGAAIYAKQAEKTVLILAEGTENTIADSENYTFAEGEDEPNAAIFSKDDLTITGSGSLTVVGNYYNAIGCKDILVITGGQIAVTAKNDGLRGRDGIAILDGAFTITADNDGLKSNNDTDAQKGYVIIDGGAFVITAGHDGIQAETDLAIFGGSFTVTTGGGAANAPARTETQGGGRGNMTPGQMPQGGWGDQTSGQMPEMPAGGWEEMFSGQMPENMPTPPSGMPGMTSTPEAQSSSQAQSLSVQNESTGTTEDSSDSYKGLKAAASIAIHGGSFTIDSQDDAVHTNGSMNITGGSFVVKTGDDGFHADGAVVIEDGQITIESCYEGIEGKTIDINGGHIYIDASDDAVNAADPDAKEQSTAGLYIRITGGVLDADGGGDVLDSNGDIFLTGGTIYLNGLSLGMDGAVDCDGTFTVTGGEMVAGGSVVTPGSASTQASVLLSFSAAKAAGSKLTVKDAADATVLEYTVRRNFTQAGFTSASFVDKSTYTLYIDDEKIVDFTISGTVTTLSDTGGAYQGMSGMPGGRGFGGQR